MRRERGRLGRCRATAAAAWLACALACAWASGPTLAAEPTTPRPPAPPPAAPASPPVPSIPAVPTVPRPENVAGAVYRLPQGETHEGSLTLFVQDAEIAGVQNGDVRFFGSSISIPGTVHGSVKAYGASLKLDGTVSRDVEAWCGTAAFGPKSDVGGDVRVYAGQAILDGKIGGDLTAACGEVQMAGTVGKDATLEADVLKFGPGARIAGDLTYSSREPISIDAKGIVGGSIEYTGARTKAKRHARTIVSRFVRSAGFATLGLIVGLLALALFRRPAEPILAALEGDPLRNVGAGFLTFIVVPVAGLVSCILIITIPLVFLVLVVWALAVYLAKVPVAVWAGGRILRAAGRPAPSPYWSLVVGTAVLYVLFHIPWFIGHLVWAATTFLGLGAMVFGIRDYRQARRSRAAQAPYPEGTPPPPPAPPEPLPASGASS